MRLIETKKLASEAPTMLWFLNSRNGRTESFPIYIDQSTKSAASAAEVMKSYIHIYNEIMK